MECSLDLCTTAGLVPHSVGFVLIYLHTDAIPSHLSSLELKSSDKYVIDGKLFAFAYGLHFSNSRGFK